MGYDSTETKFLVSGFKKGFDLGYRGPTNRQNMSSNIPFTKGVGNAAEMWNKIMKEVGEKCIAGPFAEIPFANYIQSPIRLVPKAGGKTRLIFHLSFAFSECPENQSVNHFIPKEWCSVKYSDLDAAVQACLSASLHVQATTRFITDISRQIRCPQCILHAAVVTSVLELVNFKGNEPS